MFNLNHNLLQLSQKFKITTTYKYKRKHNIVEKKTSCRRQIRKTRRAQLSLRNEKMAQFTANREDINIIQQWTDGSRFKSKLLRRRAAGGSFRGDFKLHIYDYGSLCLFLR